MAQGDPDYALGFEDETWWSRLTRPQMHAWTEAGKPLRLIEQSVANDDPDPKALACYGMLVYWPGADGVTCEQPWLRFVDGRPISGVTTAFLDWSCRKLEMLGKKRLVLVWDNASWHVSREVRNYLREHNRQVTREGSGVRIVPCYLPIKSPWLNPIEPCWIHGKRKVVEADRLLSASELEDRICAHFGCSVEDHLTIPQKVA